MATSEINRPSPRDPSPNRPRALILFGAPGSGKGTQARLLSEALRIPTISTGDMLREHIQAGDAIGKGVSGTMGEGHLVSDELVSGLVTERLAQGDCEQGFILDGYPRTRQQAETLDRMLAERGLEPVVIHLVVDYNIVIARLSRRSQCPLCGTLYNATSKPPRAVGVCDKDGAKLAVRDDDQAAVVRERLDAYQRQTKPLLEYFRQTGRRLEEIDASYQTPAILSGQIRGILERP